MHAICIASDSTFCQTGLKSQWRIAVLQSQGILFILFAWFPMRMHIMRSEKLEVCSIDFELHSVVRWLATDRKLHRLRLESLRLDECFTKALTLARRIVQQNNASRSHSCHSESKSWHFLLTLLTGACVRPPARRLRMCARCLLAFAPFGWSPNRRSPLSISLVVCTPVIIIPIEPESNTCMTTY
jgi:hypothetical protein